MIKASRLFLVPVLSMLLLVIPYGFIGTIFILFWWYCRNDKQIHAYFRGNNTEMKDINTTELEKMK